MGYHIVPFLGCHAMKLAYQVNNECVYWDFWRMDYFKQSPHTYSTYLSLGSLIQTCFADIPNPRLDERTEQEWFAYVTAKIIPIHILWSQRCVLYHLLKHDFLVLFKGLMEDGFSERDSSKMHQRCQRCAHLFVGCMQIWSPGGPNAIACHSMP